MLKEFEFINKYLQQHAGKRRDVLQGINDDCALVTAPKNHELAISTDSLVLNTHFFSTTPPEELGYRALAVNLSDLAAMGAEPAWATLSLTLPTMDEPWLDKFCTGFFKLLQKYKMQLIGGDTTRGPLSITVQVTGFVPHGKAILRSGAKEGDIIYVTGHLGAAGVALKKQQLIKPYPRIKEGIALRGIATAAIDISDGLAGDLKHILHQSHVGAIIDTNKLPLAPNATIELALSAGEDYELCFTAPANKKIPFKHYSAIGKITKSLGLQNHLDATGYEHSWEEAQS